MTFSNNDSLSGATTSEERASILVVDDDAVVRESFRQVLTAAGHDTIVAETASDAIRYLYDNRPDAILLDLVLPDMDGLMALEELRQIPHLNDVAVVIVTSRTDVETLIEAIEYGADDFITKPFLLEDARRKIEFVLKDRSEKHSLTETVFDTISTLNIDDKLKQRMKTSFIWHFDAVYVQFIRYLIDADYSALRGQCVKLHTAMEYYNLDLIRQSVSELDQAIEERSFGRVIDRLEGVYTRFEALRRQID
ncbi:MAG: response regulator [Calditrichia bacterium]